MLVLANISYQRIEIPFHKSQKLKIKVLFGFNIALLLSISTIVYTVSEYPYFFRNRADLLQIGTNSLRRKLPSSESNTTGAELNAGSIQTCTPK